MNEKIQKLMKNHLISSREELNSVIGFVSELIDLEIQHDEKMYPYAIVSHRQQKTAYYIVRRLEDFINEHYEESL